MSTEPTARVTEISAAGPAAEIVEAAAQMRVVRGAPDDLEVAALVAGLVAVASSGAHLPDDVPAPAQWTRRSRPAPALPTGGDSWRWSLR
ncbi:Acyl-CoA carboxylase epsilon subunit [Sanguibacter gelidistatuariae]|uniref:Acyl-CoA carboxylase epsilon subunit n=1 Tax=Sanguibacter gelidistatuariae TaxID=1814289 RepID=A0A1G6MMP5_9MICO|nr:acyl-CoA carboxylase subunit epsilon [Sanguibacter gelidistatuariae]SDC56780.1 Acyl-CoA carboxylase epsilon subunit [Sanguibacter gelidistatuariae]